jgi:UDP-sulfoquinovose synthase
MKILILGIDGYIGRPLAKHLEGKGHEVVGLDNNSRRLTVESLTELKPITFPPLDVENVEINKDIDAIVHLAQQPSAPWSMKNEQQCNITQIRNIESTLHVLWQMKENNPDAHLVKLGSMGEYGTPNVDIPEGFIELRPCEMAYPDDCPMDGMMFPRQPNSFYHLSKVFDSMNIEFSCRTWGLRSTDIMQGIVFGLNYWDDELTRFDYDQYFGTVINRFCAQAVSGHPLTVYGTGGQQRAFLPLQDSIECLTLAIENPPDKGEYRVFNQYAKWRSILDLAKVVSKITRAEIKHIDNPRTESEKHHYMTTNEKLRKLGYFPKWSLEEEVKKLIDTIKPFKDRINQSVIMPTTEWK